MAVIASAGLLLLVAVALAALHTPAAKRYVLGRAVELAADRGIGLDAGSLDYNLLRLSITARDLVVRSDAAPDLPPLVRASRVHVRMGLLALLGGRYVVHEGAIDDLELHVVTDAGGRDNLPRLPDAGEPDEAGTPVDYLIESFAVRNAGIRYEDRTRAADVTAHVPSLDVAGDALTGRHQVRLDPSDIAIEYDGRQLDVRLSAEAIDLGRDDVRLDAVQMASDVARLMASGTVIGFAQPDLDVVAGLDVALDELASLARVAEPVEGRMRVDATLRGPLDRLQVDATIDATEVAVRTLRDIDVSAAAAFDGATRRIALDEVHLAGAVGRIDASGIVALDAGAGESAIAASFTDLDLAVLMRAAGLEYVVGSRATGRLNGAMPGLDYAAATGDARVSLRPVGQTRRHVVPLAGSVDAEGSRERMSARLSQMRALGASADGSVTLAGGRAIGGSVVLAADDLAPVIAGVEALLDRAPGTLAPTSIAGAATVRAELGGTIDAPTAQVTIAAPALSVGQAPALQVDGTLSYAPAAVRVQALDVRWAQAHARVSGTVGLEGARPLALDVFAEQLSLRDVLLALEHGDVPVSGIASAVATIGGSVDAPEATVSLRAEDLAAYGEPLGLLTGEVIVSADAVARADLRLEKPQPDGTGVIAIAGTYRLDDGRFEVDAGSDRLQLTELTIGDDVPVRGWVELSARASGTVDDPVAAVRVEAGDIEVAGEALGPIAVSADVAERRARLEISAARFAAEASAEVALVDGYPGEIALAIRDLDLSMLPLPSHVPLAGRLRAVVEAAGDLSRPEALAATAVVEALDTSWNGQPIRLDGPATLRYVDERIVIDSFVVRAGESVMCLAGDLPLEDDPRAGHVEVAAELDLPTLALYAPADLALVAEGRARLDGRVTGSLRAIDPTLTLAIEGGAVSAAGFEPGLTDLAARVELSEGELRVPELSAALGAARLEATAQVPLAVLPEDLPVSFPRASGEARASIDLTALDLATVPGAPDALSGVVGITAEFTAARPALDALVGEATFPELAFALDGLAFAQQGTSRVVVEGGVARIEQMTLEGSAGRIDVRGSAGLVGDRMLDLAAAVRLELAAVSALAGGLQADGPLTLDVTATGPLATPSVDGFIEVTDARIAYPDPAVALDELHARVDLSRDRAVLSRLDGTLNGGTLSGTGALAFGGGTISDVSLALTVTDMALDVPLDLRSIIDADLRVTEQDDLVVVGGTVTIQEAGLTQDLAFDRGLLAGLAGPRSLDLTTDRNPLLERVRFDVRVTTATPVVLDNNLARGEVTADLRVLGTPYEPGMSGRLVVEEDSTVTLNERAYVVERGILTFVEERRIVPVFDLRMTTRASTYDIVLSVSGPPDDTETTLTSDPPLPEPDILALLVTGRTLDEVRGEEVARAQVLSYVSGLAGSSLGRGLERATGLSRVRIEPNLIAGEADPGARLTIGQDITDALRLVYSTDLVNGGDEIWVAEYDVTRRFQASAVRQSDASYRFDVRHDVRFGGRPEPRRAAPQAPPRVGDVRIEGDTGLPASEVLRRFGVESGRPYSFFDVRRGVERLDTMYRRAGLLQARVRVRRAADGDRVHLTIAIDPGPSVDLRYAGVTPPRGVRDEVALVWHSGVFDGQRTTDAERVLREWLVGRDRVAARLEHHVEDLASGDRRVTFTIDEGPRYRTVDLAFDGPAGIPASELEEIVDEQGLRRALFTDPVRVTELLERYYREQGYLSARVSVPQYEFSGDAARVIVPVEEGPRFIVRAVETSGNEALPSALLLGEGLIRPGDPYLPAVVERSLARMRALYGERGYNDANVTYALALDRDAGRVDLTFAMAEGRRERVAAIEVEGNEQTSTRLVTRQLTVEEGEPLPLPSLGASRRRLYDTRAFALVDLVREELPPAGPLSGGGAEGVPAANGSAPAAIDGAADKPVRLRVVVREVQPFQIRYGGFYDTERGPGGIVDFSSHNSLGAARVAGLRTRYDAQLREGRLYLSQPALRDMPLETTANLFAVQERHPATLETAALNIDRIGLSIQQEARLRDSIVLNYGYRFERQRAYDRAPPRLRDETTRVSPVTGAITRDTRDDVLDASRGQFMSHALSISPGVLGADQSYLKYFGQFFLYRPLQPERRERFTGEIVRPRLVYAAGVRLGLAAAIGDGRVPVGERFLGGGSTTLRGFAQHAVGPTDNDGFPGGEATIVLNNEIRVPLISRLDGVAFLDVGNVFARVSALSFGLRSSGGVGLRVRTPWFLGRVDYGVPFDRREGEARGQLFFSIGQAF